MIELRREFEKEMSIIPDFIDTHSERHHKIWLTMMDCNDIIMIMIVDRVLKESSIKKISAKFDEFLSESMKIDISVILNISVYFTVMLEYLSERCLEEEEFESAANLKLFNEIHFQNINQTNNE